MAEKGKEKEESATDEEGIVWKHGRVTQPRRKEEQGKLTDVFLHSRECARSLLDLQRHSNHLSKNTCVVVQSTTVDRKTTGIVIADEVATEVQQVEFFIELKRYAVEILQNEGRRGSSIRWNKFLPPFLQAAPSSRMEIGLNPNRDQLLFAGQYCLKFDEDDKPDSNILYENTVSSRATALRGATLGKLIDKLILAALQARRESDAQTRRFNRTWIEQDVGDSRAKMTLHLSPRGRNDSLDGSSSPPELAEFKAAEPQKGMKPKLIDVLGIDNVEVKKALRDPTACRALPERRRSSFRSISFRRFTTGSDDYIPTREPAQSRDSLSGSPRSPLASSSYSSVASSSAPGGSSTKSKMKSLLNNIPEMVSAATSPRRRNRTRRSKTAPPLFYEVAAHVPVTTHPSFLEEFIFSYRTILSPLELLKALLIRYVTPPPPPMDLDTMRTGVVEMMKRWLLLQTTDFREDDTMYKYFKFCVTTPKKQGGVLQETHRVQLRSLLGIKLKEDKLEEFLAKGMLEATATLPTPSSARSRSQSMNNNKASQTLKWKHLKSKEVARQMALLEFALFKAIKPSEWLSKDWRGSAVPKPNILILSKHFNQMSNWVSSEILSHDGRETRARMIMKFIGIARHCGELNNFNGVLEILSGLNNAAIARLKDSWEEVTEVKMEQLMKLEELMSLKHNRQNYRNRIEEIRFAAPRQPCVPYPGTFLTDLTFIEEANPKEWGEEEEKKGKEKEEEEAVSNNNNVRLINWEKLKMISRTIHMLRTFQRVPFRNIEPNPQIQRFLREAPPCPADEDLYKRSLEIRPLEQRLSFDLGIPPAEEKERSLEEEEEETPATPFPNEEEESQSTNKGNWLEQVRVRSPRLLSRAFSTPRKKANDTRTNPLLVGSRSESRNDPDLFKKPEPKKRNFSAPLPRQATLFSSTSSSCCSSSGGSSPAISSSPSPSSSPLSSSPSSSLLPAVLPTAFIDPPDGPLCPSAKYHLG
ncbi:hypothetical protein QOT17_023445 [Balamuthia mandrillaris]